MCWELRYKQTMEKLYHYIWQTRIGGNRFRGIDGEIIEVIDAGIHNENSGPDFFNAKIKIDGDLWIGNVEIHVKASDWFRHGHTDDPAYDNVILHVVAVSDKRAKRSDGSLIPEIQLTMPESFFRTLTKFNEDGGVEVKCGPWLHEIPALQKTDWLECLAVERVQQKAEKVLEIHRNNAGDWEQTCFIIFARGLGFGLNGDPFELLAKSVPLRVLHHHSDNLMQLEAILFGQAAMLDPTYHMFDDYFQGLCREYYFLARKYGLRPMRAGLWKYSRTRPQNFPHRRIALLASSASGGFSLFSRILAQTLEKEKIEDVFEMHAEGFWRKHYSFDTPSGEAPYELSASSRMLLAINVAVPLIYAYAKSTGDMERGEAAMNILNRLPAENNSILRRWKDLGIDARDAARSQALIQLNKEYCEKKKCMYCRFGHRFLRKAATLSDTSG